MVVQQPIPGAMVPQSAIGAIRPPRERSAKMITKLRNRTGFIASPSRILISERKEQRLVPMAGIRSGGVWLLDHSYA